MTGKVYQVLPSKYVLTRTAQVTLVAAAVSISISTGIRWLVGAEADGITIAIRLILPFVIAIPIGLVWFGRLEKLNNSYAALLAEMRQLAKAAAADPLTGLLNRRSFIEQFELARSHGVSGTFIMADVDYLKAINDTYGHLGGDEAIIAVGEALARVLGDGSIIGRIGGDEFCAFVPRSLGEADSLNRIINTTAASLFRERSGIHDFNLSVTLGVETTRPGFSFRDVFARSDEKLYVRKLARAENEQLNDAVLVTSTARRA